MAHRFLLLLRKVLIPGCEFLGDDDLDHIKKITSEGYTVKTIYLHWGIEEIEPYSVSPLVAA